MQNDFQIWPILMDKFFFKVLAFSPFSDAAATKSSTTLKEDDLRNIPVLLFLNWSIGLEGEVVCRNM